MQRIKAGRLLLGAACTLMLLVGSVEAATPQKRLSPQERKVVDYLLADWNEEYSVTSVDIAMDALKVHQSDETRFRIGSHIKAHPELHEVIRRWGWVTLVLTPEEKLIARALINAQRDGKPSPGIPEIANMVGIAEAQVGRGLRMLERYQITKADKLVGGAGHRVPVNYIKWEPRLDFLFHKVTVDSGRQFNTN
ncbi:MAG: hypothetical protein ACRD8U_02985 [Pyrinomonadaceae bacterium]